MAMDDELLWRRPQPWGLRCDPNNFKAVYKEHLYMTPPNKPSTSTGELRVVPLICFYPINTNKIFLHSSSRIASHTIEGPFLQTVRHHLRRISRPGEPGHGVIVSYSSKLDQDLASSPDFTWFIVKTLSRYDLSWLSVRFLRLSGPYPR